MMLLPLDPSRSSAALPAPVLMKLRPDKVMPLAPFSITKFDKPVPPSSTGTWPGAAMNDRPLSAAVSISAWLRP